MAAWRRLTAGTSIGTSQSALRPIIDRSPSSSKREPAAEPLTSSRNAMLLTARSNGNEAAESRNYVFDKQWSFAAIRPNPCGGRGIANCYFRVGEGEASTIHAAPEFE